MSTLVSFKMLNFTEKVKCQYTRNEKQGQCLVQTLYRTGTLIHLTYLYNKFDAMNAFLIQVRIPCYCIYRAFNITRFSQVFIIYVYRCTGNLTRCKYQNSGIEQRKDSESITCTRYANPNQFTQSKKDLVTNEVIIQITPASSTAYMICLKEDLECFNPDSYIEKTDLLLS